MKASSEDSKPLHVSLFKVETILPVMYGLLIRLVIINLFVKSSGEENWKRFFDFNMILNLQSKSLDCS